MGAVEERTAGRSEAGPRLRRQDGPEKVSGAARYVADLRFAGTAYAKLLWAGVPHARITRLDTSRARALSGVLAVLTQEDLPLVRHGRAVQDRTLLAHDVVRFDGEAVAAVAATSPEVAAEAARLIEVEYAPLPAIADPERALEPDAPLIHAEWEQYASLEVEGQTYPRSGNDCGHVSITKGDPDRALAEAAHLVKGRYATDMSHPVPIEPHAIVAQWQGESLTIWSTTQVPFLARAWVAATLDVAERNVRIVVPHLGGGFGGKCEFHLEAHVAALARAARRPVRLVLSREEEFTVLDMLRHPIVVEVETGLAEDGTIRGRRARVVLDTGAYAAHGPIVAEVTTMMAAGPYRIPHLQVDAHAVYTNRTPAGSTRGPGAPQVCWAIEQHTDELAEHVGLTPFEFRMRNLVEDGDAGPTGQTLSAVGAKRCLEEAVRSIDPDAPRPPGEAVGLACGWYYGSVPHPSDATVRMNDDGTATVLTGAQENGSGAVMGLAILAAQELGLRPEQVTLVYQDTELGVHDMGSEGSQTTFNNGRAVKAAAGMAARRLREAASRQLEIGPDDLELSGGAVVPRGDPAHAVPLADVVKLAHETGDLIMCHAGAETQALPEASGATTAGRLLLPTFAAPGFFCHAARVRVDTATGVTTVLEVAACHDFGRIVNPIGAEGQVEGGVVHAVGMALTEGTVFDGLRQANPNLSNYKLMTAADAPPVYVGFIRTDPELAGPGGSKGVGESPVIPTAGAVANAIARAIGARVRCLPMTAERVWSALEGSRS